MLRRDTWWTANSISKDYTTSETSAKIYQSTWRNVHEDLNPLQTLWVTEVFQWT